MSDSTRTVLSQHHFDTVDGSSCKLQTATVDVLGKFSNVISRPIPHKPVNGHGAYMRSATSDEADSLYSQLWHACAGSLVSLPKKSSRVVYFPQGHIEQVAACTNQGVDMQMPHYNLPSQIVCRVLNMNLSAERETDEVYAQMTLVPDKEKMDLSGDDEEIPLCPKRNVHMFIKTLTASDTSTHGGFSVPRRAAEECLPSLDYQQSPPTQDLVAKDLHGVEWKFRHIYRGHPKRHLLTTGWSVFVSQKRLVAGDAVIFLRGENGELRLGVRRSIRQQSSVTSSSLLSSHSMHLGVLAAAAHAVSTNTMFSIFYNPRTSPAEFVIPYHKFVSTLRNNLTVGMRFKMRFETEESSERRCMGTITGVGDLDAARWPNSKWRCLKVEWDEQIASERQERVSPWEIEPFVAPTVLSLPEPRSTRLRMTNTSSIADLSLIGVGNTQLDMVSSMHYQRALQNNDMRSSGIVAEEDREGMPPPASWNVRTNNCKNEKKMDNMSSTSLAWSDVKTSSIKISGMAQDFQVPRQLTDKILDMKHHQMDALQSGKEDNVGRGNVTTPHPSSTTLSTERCEPELHLSMRLQDMQDGQKRIRQGYMNCQNRNDLTLWWSPDCAPLESSSQSLPQSNPTPESTMDWLGGMRSESFSDKIPIVGAPEASLTASHSKMEYVPLAPGPQVEESGPSLRAYPHQDNEHGSTVTDQDCKIFGFTLNAGCMGKDVHPGSPIAPDDDDRSAQVLHASTSYHSSFQVDCVPKLCSVGKEEIDPLETGDRTISQPRGFKQQDWPRFPLRTRVKVYKQGAVGRAVDISKFDSYDDLFRELNQLFKIEGALNEPGSGWQLVYIDHEGDMLLVGDDPWPEFCDIVRKIRILSPSEVDRMAYGSNLEDQGVKETSKCSADCQDSSAPTTPNARSSDL